MALCCSRGLAASILVVSVFLGAAAAQPRRALAQDGILSLSVPDASSSTNSSSDTGSISVESADAFTLALLDPNTTTIRIVRDIILNSSSIRDQLLRAVGGDGVVNLTRSVMVIGTSNFPLLDFGMTPSLIRLGVNISIEFRALRLRGIYERLDDAPIIFTNDSIGWVRFNNVYSQRTACLVPQLQLEKEMNAAKATALETNATDAPSQPPPMSPAAQFPPGLPSLKPASPPTSPPSIDDSATLLTDSPMCFSDLSSESMDALGTDDCYDTALLLQDLTFTITMGGPQDSDIAGGLSGSSRGLHLSFNMTILLCDVFVRPPCSEQTGAALSACIQELLDRRSLRPPSPPSPPPLGSVGSSSPVLPPPSSRAPSPPGQVDPQPSESHKSTRRLEVLLPALLVGLAPVVAVLGAFLWWRWRLGGGGKLAPAGGAGTGAGGKLQEQDSEVLQLQIHGGTGGHGSRGAASGGRGGGGKGSKVSSTPPASPATPPAPHMRFLAKYGRRSSLGMGLLRGGGGAGAGAGGAGSSGAGGGGSGEGKPGCSGNGAAMGSAGLSSSLTGLTLTCSPGASPSDSANADPTRGIALHHMLGSGSFGRVYYGTWQGQGVAIKIIPHSEAAHHKVQQEVALCLRFNHPNVVRSLYYATFEACSQEMPTQDGSLPTSAAGAGGPGGGGAFTMETWIVLEFCNAGSLASHLGSKAAALGTAAGGGPSALSAQQRTEADPRVGEGQGEAAMSASGALAAQQQQQEAGAVLLHMHGMLCIARDIAAGMAHLHSLNVCHGDLKCENVLLCRQDATAAASQQQQQQGSDGDNRVSGSGSGYATAVGAAAAERSSCQSQAACSGRRFVAKVADFGLSKTFNETSTHMSTATVGTVTHMCPVLLLTGKMRPSCDVFSFGIMLWQMATGSTPFANMRYAEIVYKVAVTGMRPEFPPHVPKQLVDMAEACWAADPTIRPTFEQLVVQLDELLEKAEDLQAEQEAVLRAEREGTVREEDVAIGVVFNEDAAVVSGWAAAAAAALLE
ncbi:hypothetical protein Agub_g8348 [Astrephomene gubernaculifera]|uniref:Protein kinase domain-containing protein n=1 Tax=Astrephomene gubernaculifera TaxID=47775 RepID=A0AAD3DRH7_9CHLO|nr:hypothetical protein Agub_g8348 [Astrephomene gubernaculifera]